MITNKLRSLWARRKAVSPVIAVILIIALTVTAAAIVYFVVVPMLKGEGELVVMSYELTDSDATPFADKMTISVHNIGTAEESITSLTVTKDGVAVNWTLSDTSIAVLQGEGRDIICNAGGATEEIGYGNNVVFTLGYGAGNTLDITIKVPAKFSHFVLQYSNDFETATDLSEWTHNIVHQHSGGTNYNTIQDWNVVTDGSNKHASCTSNDCQFIILEDSQRDFYDVNITYDLRTDDDDGNGIIFRYDNSGPYANFYCVWFTRQHPGASNPSNDGDAFDWVTPSDRIVENEITIHYVEGDADGYNWYKLDSAAWTRSNNVWYSWRVVMDGPNGALYVDNSETAILDWTDGSLSHGYIGFASFANLNSDYDNIYVWQTETI